MKVALRIRRTVTNGRRGVAGFGSGTDSEVARHQTVKGCAASGLRVTNDPKARFLDQGLEGMLGRDLPGTPPQKVRWVP